MSGAFSFNAAGLFSFSTFAFAGACANADEPTMLNAASALAEMMERKVISALLHWSLAGPYAYHRRQGPTPRREVDADARLGFAVLGSEWPQALCESYRDWHQSS